MYQRLLCTGVKNMKEKQKWVNQHEHDGFLKNALAIKGSVTPKVFKKSSFCRCVI